MKEPGLDDGTVYTLGRRGHSTDHRPDLKQMIVGAVLDAEGRPIHVVWGIPAGKNTPGVLVTSYRT